MSSSSAASDQPEPEKVVVAEHALSNEVARLVAVLSKLTDAVERLTARIEATAPQPPRPVKIEYEQHSPQSSSHHPQMALPIGPALVRPKLGGPPAALPVRNPFFSSSVPPPLATTPAAQPPAPVSRPAAPPAESVAPPPKPALFKRSNPPPPPPPIESTATAATALFNRKLSAPRDERDVERDAELEEAPLPPPPEPPRKVPIFEHRQTVSAFPTVYAASPVVERSDAEEIRERLERERVKLNDERQRRAEFDAKTKQILNSLIATHSTAEKSLFEDDDETRKDESSLFS